jgi:hypothetical protein
MPCAKRKITFTILLIHLISIGTLAASDLQGTVEGNVLTSTAFPRGTIEFASGLDYIGSEKFVLYKVADCEIHVFAEVEKGRLSRFYWVQFEGYLPKKKRYKYDYSKSKYRTNIGSHEFYDDVWFSTMKASRKKWKSGSDVEHVFALLESKGITVGDELMGIRLVRLNDDRRKEMMIIYYEDLAPLGFKAADLRKGGKDDDKGLAVAGELRKKALEGMTHKME